MSNSNLPKRLQEHEFHQLEMLYSKIEKETTALTRFHAERLHCTKGCYQCCQDEITVFEVEADWIRDHYPQLLATGTPSPRGMCAFLDEQGGCRVYQHRPYVCRTQGLPLEWEEEAEDDEVMVYRSICPLNEAGTPIEALSTEVCWTMGPMEARLATLQSRRGEPLQRVALRELFSTDTVLRVTPLSEGFDV